MNAKDALFREMGWAQDAKDDPRQMRLPGFEPQEQPNGNSSNAGAGKSPSKWGQKTFEEHAKECEAQSKETCPIFKRELPKELAKPENRGKSEEEVANELWARHQGYKQQEEQEKAAKKAESLEKEIPLTPQQVLPQPKELEADGVDVVVATTVGEMTVEGLKSLIENPDVSDEIREEAKKQLELLSKNPATAVTEKTATGPAEATATSPETTQVQPPEIDWANAISDDLYGKIKDTPEIKAYKQALISFLLGNRDYDASQLPKGSIKERVLNEALADLKASGEKVFEYQEEPVEVDDLDFDIIDRGESAEQHQLSEAIETAELELDNIADTLSDLSQKEQWSQGREKVMRDLSQRLKSALRSAKIYASADTLDELSGAIKQFQTMQKRWASLPQKSEARKEGQENIVSELDKQVAKTEREILAEQLETLLASDKISPEIKIQLRPIYRVFSDALMTEKEGEIYGAKYAKLNERYQLSQMLAGDEEDEFGNKRIEDDDENHKQGKVTASDEADKDYKVDISDIPDVESHNGSLTNGDAITEKMAKDLSEGLKLNIDASDIKVTPLMAMTEFSFAVPEGITLSQSQGDAILPAIQARFPLKDIRKGNEIAPQKAVYKFDPSTQTFTISVENEEKGAFSQKKLLESKEFKDAIEAGGVPVIMGVDAKQKPIIRDLTDIVHALMVGSSGAGKSIMIKDIITGLLSQSPYNVRLGLVDLAGVELPAFDGAKHMIRPTATTPEAAAKLFNWYANEMNARLSLFKKAKVKDLAQYNKLGREGKLPKGMPTHLPFLPLIVDEFSDLMDNEQKNNIINTLNKMSREARKTGIHMFLATQKGTTDFIPSSISSQASTRIGLAQTDSKNAKAFGTPDAANIPTRSGGFQMRIGGALVSGTSGILPDEGYDDIAKRFAQGGDKASATTPEGSSTTTSHTPIDTRYNTGSGNPVRKSYDDIIDSIATSPDAREKLTIIAGRVTSGDMRPFAVGEQASSLAKKLLDAMGVPYNEAQRADGKIIITPEASAPKSGETSGGSSDSTQSINASATGASGGTEATLPDNGAPENKTPESTTATPNPERDSIDESLRPRYDAEQGALEQRIADAAAARDKVLNGNRKPTEQQAAWELYEDTVNAAIEKANGWRVANGLPKITGLDKSGKFEYEKPAEKGSEAGGSGTESGQENAGETSVSKPLTRQEYEAKYPQTREGQMRRVKEERDAALDAKWQELSEKGLSPAQIKQDKGYKGLLKTYADEEAEINEQFPEQQSAEKETGNGAPSSNSGISIKDDTSKLTGDNKLQYEAALNDYNRGMANLREQRKNGEISGKEFREGAAQLLNDLNTERAEVGFTQPVDAAGAFKEPEQKEGNVSATSTATSPETATAETDGGTEAAETEAPAETQQNQENTEQVDEQNAETQEAPKRTRYTSTVNEANYAGDDELSMEAEDFNETIQELNDKKDGIGLKKNEQRLSAKEYIRRVNEAIDTFNAALKEAGRENEQLPKFAQRKATQPKAGEEKQNETGSDVNGGNTDREVKGTEVVSSEVKAGNPEAREERSGQNKVDGLGEVKSEAEAVRSDDAGGGDDAGGDDDAGGGDDAGGDDDAGGGDDAGGDDDAGGGDDTFEEAMKLTNETIGKRISGLPVGKRRSLEDMFLKSQQDWTDEQRKAFLTKAGNYLEKNRKLSPKGTQEYLSKLAKKISNVDVKTKNVEQTDKNGTVNKSDDNRENITASGSAEVEKTKNGSDRQSEVKRTEAVEGTQAVAQKPEETSGDDTVVTEEDDTAEQGGNAATQTNPDEQEETAETSEEQSAVETKEETHQQNETGGTSASRPLTDEEVAEKVNNHPYIKELEERRKQANSNGVKAKLGKKIKETKKFLEGAIRNAASPDSGVQDVRTLKWRESDGGTGGSEELKKAVKEDASVAEARKQLEKAEQSGKDSDVYQEAKEKLERTINNARINAASKQFLAKFGDTHGALDKEIKKLEKSLNNETKKNGDDSRLAVRLQQQLENAVGRASTIDKTMTDTARRNAAALIKAIENNDADYLKSVFQGPASHLNGKVSYQEDMGSRDAFEMITGIKLPEAHVELGDFEPTGQIDDDGDEVQAYSQRLNKWIDDFCAANRQSNPAHTQGNKTQGQKTTATTSKGTEAFKTKKDAKKTDTSKKKTANKEESQSRETEASAPDIKSVENPFDKTAEVSGGANADYNQQSKEVRQRAKEQADLSRSRGMQILSEMKAPAKIDNQTARELNAKLAGVAREIQILEHKLNDEEKPLSKKDRTQALGLIENLRQGLQDVYMKNRLGKGNFTFSPQKVDNRIVGLTIKDYKGDDGEMHPVKVSERSDFSKMSKSEKIAAVRKIIDKETLRHPNRGTPEEISKAASELVEAASKKDSEALVERLRPSNPGERTAFEAMTGIKLPLGPKETLRAIDNYFGISEEKRQKMTEQKAQKEAQKAAAAKAAETERIKSEDDAFNAAIKEKTKLWDAESNLKTIKSLMDKGWRFEIESDGKTVGFWSPDNNGYFIDKKMKEGIKNFNKFLAGAIRYGENLDKKASKPTKDEAITADFTSKTEEKQQENDNSTVWSDVFDAALASMC